MSAMPRRTTSRPMTWALGLCACLIGMPASAVQPGEPAPALNLPGLDGRAVDLDRFKGQVVVLDFWASWCGPCRQSFPWLAQMQAKYGPRGLQVVAVNVDRQRADADVFLSQVAAPFVVLFDAAGETPRRYAVAGMPSTMLIGADGRVRLHHRGFRDDQKPALEAAIVEALDRRLAAANR